MFPGEQVKKGLFPSSSEVKIDFCTEKKKFFFSVPIAWADHEAVRVFAKARKGHTFAPHTTYFFLDEILLELIQELSFRWGYQPSMRQQVAHFRHLAKRCHRMLAELVLEDWKTRVQ